jgi:hypothetical protein
MYWKEKRVSQRNYRMLPSFSSVIYSLIQARIIYIHSRTNDTDDAHTHISSKILTVVGFIFVNIQFFSN